MVKKATSSNASFSTTRGTEVDVCLTGMNDIMFDRYPGDNNTKLRWEQKIYLVPGTNILALPSMNVLSFLSAHNTNSAPKRLRDKRAYKDICNACLSFVSINGKYPGYIPFTRNGAEIEVGKFGPENEPQSGIYLDTRVARLDKGVPNPKHRPVLPTPWQLEFMLKIFPNSEISEQEIRNLMDEGGLAIGLGTYRGVFGKFRVDTWNSRTVD